MNAYRSLVNMLGIKVLWFGRKYGGLCIWVGPHKNDAAAERDYYIEWCGDNGPTE